MRNKKYRRWRPLLTVVLVCAAVAAGTGPAGAQAPDGQGSPLVRIVDGPHGHVAVAAGWVRDKAALDRPERSDPGGPGPATPGAGPVVASNNQWLAGSRRTTARPRGGAPGLISASGRTFVQAPYLAYYASFTQTSSRVAWLGRSPWAADSIRHTDRWRVDSFGDPFTFAGAPDSAVARRDPGSLEVSWSTTVSGTWLSEHTWDRVDFMPTGHFGEVYRISHSVTGVFQFGSAFYQVDEEADAFTW
ncbi:hypothetical protein GCM10010399_50410 [Dactylosporangium fulvum]